MEEKKYLDLEGLTTYHDNLMKLFKEMEQENQEKLEWKSLGAVEEGTN